MKSRKWARRRGKHKQPTLLLWPFNAINLRPQRMPLWELMPRVPCPSPAEVYEGVMNHATARQDDKR